MSSYVFIYNRNIYEQEPAIHTRRLLHPEKELQETSTNQKFALQVQNDSQDSGMFSRDVSNNDNLMSYSPRFQGYFNLKNLDNVP